MIDKCLTIIRDGGEIDYDQALELALEADLNKLCEAAAALGADCHGADFDLCPIINARSGKCSEDCRYCAQSVHHNCRIETYDMVEFQTAMDQAVENDGYGVKRLSLVTAGRSLSAQKMAAMGHLYQEMASRTDLLFCASMGFLTPETAGLLVSYGVRRYHCNLEACRDYFPSICTTHSWQDKVKTLKIARDAGMDLCSGGIIGMGETLEHRLQLAFELRDLDILSIPINILNPIAATPLENIEPISLEDVLRCVALFRLINPRAIIRIAGGRDRFAGEQYLLFASGANGAIVGDYLTTGGAGVVQDLEALARLGFDVPRAGRGGSDDG